MDTQGRYRKNYVKTRNRISNIQNVLTTHEKERAILILMKENTKGQAFYQRKDTDDY